MKKKVKWVLAVFVLILCAAGYLAAVNAPVAVETETVARGDMARRVTVRAEVVPRYSTVLSSATAGTVMELPFQPGESVAAGEILARTDAASQVSLDLQREQLRAQLDSANQEYDRLYGENGAAQSEYEVAKSGYDFAEKSYGNGLVLARGGSLAQSELDALKAERDRAYQAYLQAEENKSDKRKRFYRSQIESLSRQLAVVEESAGPGAVYMPYDGVLWELYAEQGEYLAPNQPVGKVYRTDDMRLRASVVSEDGAALEPGMEAEAVYADGTRDAAEVVFISTVATKEISAVGLEENRRTVELVPGRLPEYAGAGQAVDVTFSIFVGRNVCTVPASAVVPDGDGNMVYVVRGGKAEAAAVETGRRESGRVEVKSGLEEGDMVITDPYEGKIRQGKRVAAPK